MDSVAVGDRHYSHSTSSVARPLFFSSSNGHSSLSMEAPFEHNLPASSSLWEAGTQARFIDGNGSATCDTSKDFKFGRIGTEPTGLSINFKLGKEYNGQSKFHDIDGVSEQRDGFASEMNDRTELGKGLVHESSLSETSTMQINNSELCNFVMPKAPPAAEGRCSSTSCCVETQAQRSADSLCKGTAAQELEGSSGQFPVTKCNARFSHGEVGTDDRYFGGRDCSHTEGVEASEVDSEHYYSPEDCGSYSSTASVVSASASPSHSALSSPGFGRSKTAPARASSKFEMYENPQNLARSQTEKGKEHRYSEGCYQMPSPAEKLSERKRKKLIENLVTIQNDGTVEVDVDRSAKIAPTLFDLDVADQVAAKFEEEQVDGIKSIPPPLNIAMLIVGTRGDVQPFVAIGKQLQERGHRIRLATHANFREFVMSNGLEFYPLGGDPKVLAGYMVKNKGFLPSGPSEISIQRKQLRAIMNSLLPACTESDGESGAPFKADAIIANPPAYGHVHVAEYLGVPLHIFFTMPWTPTNEFPHPLARVKQQAGYRISYLVVDSLMWWGMRGLINEFRIKKLKLRPITYFNMNQGSISHLPTGYMWSPHLVPKPKDWGPRVDVVGFCFLNLAADYRPPDALVEWLQAGEKPIYVGFGSLPVEDPGRMTEIIVQALQETNQRGIIDKGWGGLGNLPQTPEFIFLLENCPHDWLFPQCAAVVHHGGAGTTAAGLKSGCPTTIVPFFGDQPFWGEQVHAKGVGPPPIPVQQFSLERLVYAIKFMLDPEVKQSALELAKQMEEEDGVAGAVDAFHRHWMKIQHKSETEPPSLFQTILFTLQRFSCIACCS